MRKILIGMTVLGALVLTAAPALAQVGFYVGVGDPVWHDGWWHDGWRRPRVVVEEERIVRPRYVVAEERVIERPACRIIQERRVRPNGTVVVRKIRTCD